MVAHRYKPSENVVAQFRSVLDASRASLPATGMALPGFAYTAPDVFDYECAALLNHQWHCLGRVDEVLEPGAFFTTELLGEPLLVVRGDDQEIRVLSNICRHRNMPLAEGRGRARRFVCSYHAWSYDRAGQLKAAPKMEGTPLDLSTCRLPVFRSEIWNGFIYANLNDDAAPLAPGLSGLDSILAPYQTADMRLVHTVEEDWATNWKCLVENFMEGYHLSVVHPRTLHGYTPTALSKKFPGGRGYTGYYANYPDKAAPRGHGADGLSDAERRRSTLFCIYPCHVASQAASLLASFSLQPVRADRVRVRWTLSVWSDDLRDAEIDQRIELWSRVNAEDREKLERLHRILGSRHAVPGPLAPDDFEGTIHDFHRYLAGALGLANIQ